MGKMAHNHGKDSHVIAVFTKDLPLQEGRAMVEHMILKKKDESIGVSSMGSNINGYDRGNADDSDNGFDRMGFLDVIRESATLFRSSSSNLLWAMVLLVSPLSALHLSCTLHTRLAAYLATYVQSLARPSRYSSLYHFLHSSVAQTFLSQTLSAPIFFTLFLLGKALIIFILSSTYSSRKPSFPIFSSIAFKMWKRLACTHMWVCVSFISLFATSGLLLLLLATFSSIMLFPESLVQIIEVGIGLSYLLLFAHLVIIGNVSAVMCMLEQNQGIGAISKAYHLVKCRRQLGLSILLSTGLCTATIQRLYLHRVIGVGEGAQMIDTTSRLWEGPLLVFMHSFVLLLDVIMCCVFYFVCKSASHIYKPETRGEQYAVTWAIED